MSPEVKESLREIATESAEELYEEYGADGLWVTKDKLPTDPGEFTNREYNKVLSPERMAAFLENGVRLPNLSLTSYAKFVWVRCCKEISMPMRYPPTALPRSLTRTTT